MLQPDEFLTFQLDTISMNNELKKDYLYLDNFGKDIERLIGVFHNLKRAHSGTEVWSTDVAEYIDVTGTFTQWLGEDFHKQPVSVSMEGIAAKIITAIKAFFTKIAEFFGKLLGTNKKSAQRTNSIAEIEAMCDNVIKDIAKSYQESHKKLTASEVYKQVEDDMEEIAMSFTLDRKQVVAAIEFFDSAIVVHGDYFNNFKSGKYEVDTGDFETLYKRFKKKHPMEVVKSGLLQPCYYKLDTLLPKNISGKPQSPTKLGFKKVGSLSIDAVSGYYMKFEKKVKSLDKVRKDIEATLVKDTKANDGKQQDAFARVRAVLMHQASHAQSFSSTWRELSTYEEALVRRKQRALNKIADEAKKAA